MTKRNLLSFCVLAAVVLFSGALNSCKESDEVSEYDNWLDEKPDDEGNISFRYSGEPVKHDSTNTEIDVIANQMGYATITPLMFDLTNHHLCKIISEWDLDK